MYPKRTLETERLRTGYYRSGAGMDRKLLLLHGNFSSSAFFLPMFQVLSRSWDVAAPDLRCFGDTEDAPLDATRGYRDWSDDVFAFVRALGWERFTLLGWSMGGNVAMQFTVDHREMVEQLILIAPGSPYGFGGSYGENGELYYPVGLGAGGGMANPSFINYISGDSRLFLRTILRTLYFKPPFHMSWAWENLFIKEITKIKEGGAQYPGNYGVSLRWPYVVAGNKGVLNAMAPPHADLSALLEVPDKPEVLWIRGDADDIVSDHSMMEFGGLGELGLAHGWPGPLVYPPQPMVTQTRRFFDRYQDRGGQVKEVVIPGGHMCPLESPEQFFAALNEFTGK